MQIATKEHTFLDAAAAAGAGKALNVKDFEYVTLFFATDGGGDAALTVKFQGAIGDSEPTDWAAAQSVTNRWDFVDVLDHEDGASIDGDTGIAVAIADDYRMVSLNVKGLQWVNARVTARSAGEVTVTGKAFNY